MSDVVMGMVKAYLDTFNEYEVKDPSLQKELQALKEKMISFANANNDPMVFYGKFTESGLQEEYTALIGKIAMASLAGERETGAGAGGDADPLNISVKDFLEQYRIPYDEVKKAGYRKNGERAYENLFAVATRTDDMLEAQTIIEDERLMWHIVKEGQLDILKEGLGKMDPLQPAMNIALEKQLEVTEEADGIEELDYLLEKLEYERIRLINHAVTKMGLVIHMANLLFTYSSSKLNTQLTGGEGKVGEASLKTMISARAGLKSTLSLMERDFGMSFDDLLEDEGLKIWLLNPQNTDETGRTKTALNPQNYKAFREIVHEEILPEKTTIEILKRKAENPVYYGI